MQFMLIGGVQIDCIEALVKIAKHYAPRCETCYKLATHAVRCTNKRGGSSSAYACDEHVSDQERTRRAVWEYKYSQWTVTVYELNCAAEMRAVSDIVPDDNREGLSPRD